MLVTLLSLAGCGSLGAAPLVKCCPCACSAGSTDRQCSCLCEIFLCSSAARRPVQQSSAPAGAQDTCQPALDGLALLRSCADDLWPSVLSADASSRSLSAVLWQKAAQHAALALPGLAMGLAAFPGIMGQLLSRQGMERHLEHSLEHVVHVQPVSSAITSVVTLRELLVRSHGGYQTCCTC